jgi:hypothetical protein
MLVHFPIASDVRNIRSSINQNSDLRQLPGQRSGPRDVQTALVKCTFSSRLPNICASPLNPPDSTVLLSCSGRKEHWISCSHVLHASPAAAFGRRPSAGGLVGFHWRLKDIEMEICTTSPDRESYGHWYAAVIRNNSSTCGFR